MKHSSLFLGILFSFLPALAQQTVTITAITPDRVEVVYITGNQEALGDWDPAAIPMKQVSDYEWEITVPLTLPAEFKFTHGNWDTQSVQKWVRDENPNIRLTAPEITDKQIYHLKGWNDTIKEEEETLNYHIHRIHSTYLPDGERVIKVSLPENYDPTKKYPVIYTLDGSALFRLAARTAYTLSGYAEDEDCGSIPESIVVGIFHNDRSYETTPNLGFNTNMHEQYYKEGSEKLKDFLFHEAVPYIDQHYPTSDYRMIVGHSNTAHFVVTLLFQPENPFQGIASFSLNGESEYLKQRLFEHLLNDPRETVYLGYGTLDLGFINIAKYMEDQQNAGILTNENLKVEKFTATHSTLPSQAMQPAIRHFFRLLNNFDDLMEESSREDFNIKEYAAAYAKKIKDAYHMETSLEAGILFSLIEIGVENKNEKAIPTLIGYYEELTEEPFSRQMLFSFYTAMENYEMARQYAQQVATSPGYEPMLILHNLYRYEFVFVDHFKDPQQLIGLLEIGKETRPENSLEFKFCIARTALKHNIENEKALRYLQEVKKDFQPNRIFTQEDLENLMK